MTNLYQLQEREDAWVLSLNKPVTGLQLGMQFILQLDDGEGRVSICIENVFQLIEGCIVREFDPEQPATLGPTLVVIHKVVEQAIAWKNGRLDVRFEDGRRIVCYPHPQYESWQIHAPDASPPLILVSEIGSPL